MDLIIVESPSKAKTISKYLGGKYKVDASGGHVRDLPEKSLGVRINDNFEPRYEITDSKKDIIARLSEEAKKAGKVYLATDPDREGEAISWHLQEVLGLDPDAENRIEFNEISKSAVENALKHPRKINHNLVDAQQARRVLDRIVGYKLSPLLNRKIQNGLSAGRVQSVALRLIVDREREIEAFQPEEYWTFTASLSDSDRRHSPFPATYNLKRSGQNVSEAEAGELEERLRTAEFVVRNVKSGVVKQHAPAPFTTSSLQQDASTKLGMTSPETMLVAQHLYEGMEINGEPTALITYIRTDSVRVSAEAQESARGFIGREYGPEYVPNKPNYYAGKKGIQDAHEAIRPINLAITPASVRGSLDRKHYNIYKLVYDRFVASQMSEARYNSMQIDVEAEGCMFRASGRSLIFAGYTAAYTEAKKDGEDEVTKKLFPPVKAGDVLTLRDLSKEQKFTKPPLRYTDASLVKAMDEKGIGRPSTYASIISVLNKRKYVKKEGKAMVPTDVAFKICDTLMKYFTDIMDVGFTARMESDLDRIEDGGVDWHTLIADFYPGFNDRLKAASTDGDEMTDIKCEKCGAPMIRRIGKYGSYLACSAYPKCRNIVSETEAEVSTTPCPKCGAMMVVKNGKYGKFLACPNYPACSQILPMDSKPMEERCPSCGGEMIEKSGRYGRYAECLSCGARKPLGRGGGLAENEREEGAGTCPECGRPMRHMRSRGGKVYFGCTGYPECKFMSWDPPTGDKCPDCGSPLVVRGKKIKCSNKECGYSAALPDKAGDVAAAATAGTAAGAQAAAAKGE